MSVTTRQNSRKPCLVEGCLEMIAPSMWKAHMTLHAQNILPGDIPLEWLQEQDSFICFQCHQIVANSRFGSHSEKCSGSIRGPRSSEASIASTTTASGQGISEGSAPDVSLPSFEEVCCLQYATIHHILQKARPSFARVLSDTLRSICVSNSEEAWLKLFMLPKCVLRALHRGGQRHKSHSIEELCKQWFHGHIASLWQYASDHAQKSNSKQPKEQRKETIKKVQSAVSKAREGLLGKACKVLTSSGIAPNIPETWNLLQQKHPKGPIPTLPDITLPPRTTALPPEFIMSVLRSFPRDTACGPSGLRIQHLIDAAEVHLPISICSSLRVVVNILASGKAPMPISRYLAGGSLTALMKNKEDLPLDICPIAVGEAMRRLTGKCLCILSKDKAAEFFGPFQLGVAYPAGAEKIIHGMRRCVQDHWNDDDFVLCKIDLTNAFNMVSRQALLEECTIHFPELFGFLVLWAAPNVMALYGSVKF